MSWGFPELGIESGCTLARLPGLRNLGQLGELRVQVSLPGRTRHCLSDRWLWNRARSG
jgi:hypothetical protein